MGKQKFCLCLLTPGSQTRFLLSSEYLIICQLLLILYRFTEQTIRHLVPDKVSVIVSEDCSVDVFYLVALPHGD